MKKQLPVLKEKFVNNWLYKLVAFVVAVAIWATTLQGRKDTMLLRNMDLEYILRPTYVAANLGDKTIQVKVAGPRVLLKKYGQSDSTIKLNLMHAELGQKTVELTASDINLPPGLRLISITPSSLDLTIKEVKSHETK